MHITVFGASGKVGRLVVAEALARGHQVTGFVHRHSNFEHHEKLRIIKGDIHSGKAVAASLEGSEAVICALGSWGTRNKDIVSSGMRHIIPGMEALQITRIVSLTGSEARDSSDSVSILRTVTRFFARLIIGKILHDGEEHIRLLKASQLDWTVLRSPIMTGGPALSYRLTLNPKAHWQTIPRKAVAKAMVDQLEGPGYIHASPFIYR